MKRRLLLLLLVLLVLLLPVAVGASELPKDKVVAWGLNTRGQCNVHSDLKPTQISAGHYHTLALESDGTVVAWGWNNYRQCNVPNGLKAVQVAAGEYHSLVLKSDGTVVAWGRNDNGQCNVPDGLIATQISAGSTHSLALTADGTVVAWGSASKCNVPDGLIATQISAGHSHSLALTNGTVVAWGQNANGQCNVPDGLEAVQISTGNWHSLALTADGTVVAWGDSSWSGQCNVPDGLIATQISAGHSHSLALTADGTVVAWGNNYNGQCNVPDGLIATQISAGYPHSLALTTTGNIVIWGQSEYNYSLWDVPYDFIATQISAGIHQSLALKSNGTVVAWGNNVIVPPPSYPGGYYYGRYDVPDGLIATQISAGGHFLALKSDGTVVAWGANGQCNVPDGLIATQISAGSHHSLALTANGTVVAWGDNVNGQCNVPDGLEAVQISAGGYHSLALTNGTVVAWGQNANGQCNVPDGLIATQISAGGYHSLALTANGTVVAWGANGNGQCNVPDGLEAVQISAGRSHSLALTADGTVVAWGSNDQGQCNVPDGLIATQISAGEYHSIAFGSHPTPPAASFTASPRSGLSPLQVAFTDTSTGDPNPTSWFWTFGDDMTSTNQHPVHTYTAPGTYTVTLTVTNMGGSDTETKTDYITAALPNTFTGTPRSGPAPLTVEFTDLTSGATSWTWEFGDGWGSYTQHPSHTYTTPGNYTVILTTYDDVTGTSGVEVATDYITVTAPLQMSSVLNGYTYDNINSVLLDDVTITLSDGTGPINTTASYGGGFYQILDLPAGTYTVKGEKAGYLPSPSYAVQLYPGTVTQKDIALGLSGVAITGTVYDVVTREVLPDAQITVTQGSMTFTDTSTSTGQYAVNGLSRGVTTTLAASLPGYTHAPITYTPTSRTPDTIDLYLIPTTIPYIGTALAGIVTDADTCNAIPHAQVNLPGYSSTTTSPTGYFFFDDIEPGTYNITATASGYLPSSEYTLTLEDGFLGWQHITLTPQPPPPPSSPEFPNFPPHNVKFTVKTLLGTPVPGVTVSAQAIEQTASPNIFERLLGINITTTPITTEIMNGTTDTNGEINFMMVEAIKYRITLTKPDVVDQVIEIYPKDDNYPFIISNGDGGPFLPDYGDPLRDILINVTTTPPGTGISPPGQIHINYTDTTHKTTNLKIQLDQQDIGTSTNNNIIDTHDTSENAANVTHTFTVDNCKGRSYIVRIDATHPDFGTVHRDYAVTFKGRRVPLGPLPESLYVYVAGFGLMLLGGIFGATSATRGMIIISFSGWLFWAFSWLDDLGAIAPVALGLVTTLAVISIITTRYREEGYL